MCAERKTAIERELRKGGYAWECSRDPAIAKTAFRVVEKAAQPGPDGYTKLWVVLVQHNLIEKGI